MSIDTLRNKVKRRGKHKQNKNEYQEIGTFIKKRRKELNITQDVVSNGICSISYLSKIENNQIIPNEFFIREIMEKLNVETTVTNTMIEDLKYLQALVKSYFYLNEKMIERTYKDIVTLNEGIVFQLGELIYGVLKEKDDLHIRLSKLENLIMNMDDYELKVYLLFTSIYYIQKENYKTALKTLNLIKDIHYNDEFLDSIYHLYSYITKQRLLKKNTSFHHYELATSIFVKYLNIKRSNNILLERISYLKDEDIKKAEKLLEGININSLDEESEAFYNILYAEVLIERGKTKDATLKLSNIESDSTFYYLKLVLLYQICKMENDYSVQSEIKTLIKEVEHKNVKPKNRIYYYTISQEDVVKLKEYLRDIAIPYSIKSSDLSKLKKYTDKIMEICIETSRYKEATQYYQKYDKELTKINTLLS